MKSACTSYIPLLNHSALAYNKTEYCNGKPNQNEWWSINKHTQLKLKFKLSFARFKGLHDDLTCLLEEDLSSICLCDLHCEMRNTEQLLRSVGLFAYKIGSLKQCNEKLAKYGPENIKMDRISVKLKPGQETAVSRQNISICSFSGKNDSDCFPFVNISV